MITILENPESSGLAAEETCFPAELLTDAEVAEQAAGDLIEAIETAALTRNLRAIAYYPSVIFCLPQEDRQHLSQSGIFVAAINVH